MEIKTEKQALEALEQGTRLWEIPDEFRRLESVSLAAVKRDGTNLLFAGTQTAEICVAAVKNAGEDVLKYVDPELRTVALIKACGISAEDKMICGLDDDFVFEYSYDPNFTWTNDDITEVVVYGKGSAEWLPAAQNDFRRIMENLDEDVDWRDIWGYNPMGANNYRLEFSPTKPPLQ